MCILFKLQYAKFGVSNLVFSKVIEEKPLGGRLEPPLVKQGLKGGKAVLFEQTLVPFGLLFYCRKSRQNLH